MALLWGCHGKSTPAPIEATAVKAPEAPSDPEEAQYKKLKSADVQVDGAVNGLNDALQATQKMAPAAGGDATKALDNVAKQLDDAGESLGDYENVSDTLEEFKKNFTAQDERRLRGINTVLDALTQVTKAANVLTDLSQNVPTNLSKQFDEIAQDVGQVQSDLEQAVVSMGGTIPDDGPTESVDPAQDQPTSDKPGKSPKPPKN